MKWPPKKGRRLEGACPKTTPLPQLEAQGNCGKAFAQAQADPTPLVCSAKNSRSESHAMLRHIVAKLSEIEAQLKSPLAVRQLHLRYCAKCGERVTNANVGGYEGKSALTGRLYCDLCVDELEDPQ
jgi:hypothetical protein